MACVMPGAPDVEAFWANIVDGVDSVTEVPESRWVHDRHFAPGNTDEHEPTSVSKWGGFVPDVGFDALAWGIPPASLASIDPAQLLALKCAGLALDDAGYASTGGSEGRAFDRERASVVYATGSGGAADLPAGFMLRVLLRSHGITADRLPPELDAYLPQITEDGLPGVLTSVIAGRVANRLDLGGKNLVVDSACASVLVALDIARNELVGGSSDLVLCGGVDLHNGVQDYVSFTAAKALSPTGRTRAFDESADGMTLAEGCGCVVLKRLADAVADGDRVYAVVRGVAGSSDGRHLGLTAPRQEGQMRAVRRAYAATGISPAAIGMVEAHGTGTATGDRTELATTTQIFEEAGAAPGSVVLGSVKSNIGHIKCASAMAALIKTARSLYHGVLPATLHLDKPIDVYDPATSPFVFLPRSLPWASPAPSAPDRRRLAGVSSFGFGGTNFHAILEAPADEVAPSGRPCWPAELFLFRSSDALPALQARLATELAGPRQADRWRLRDVAAAVCAEGSGPVVAAVVASSLDDLLAPAPLAPGGFGPDQELDLAVALPALRGSEAVVRDAFGLFGVAAPTPGPGPGGHFEGHGVTALLHHLGQLALDGAEVDVAALFAGRGAEPSRWTDPPRAPGWTVNGHYARSADGSDLPKGLRPATTAPPLSFGGGEAAVAAAAAAAAGAGATVPAGDVAVVAEYLQIVQGVLASGEAIVRAQAGAR
jgi:acyl transferase domain-containing protein